MAFSYRDPDVHERYFASQVAATSRPPSAVCPECRSGKHRNCDGTALDEAADDIVECRCPPAFHPEKRTN